MAKIKNSGLAGLTVNIAGEVVAFDGDGVAEVNAEQLEIVTQLEGYEVVEGAAEAPKAAKPAKSKKDDAKVEE